MLLGWNLLPRALPGEKRQCTPGHPLLMLRINSPCSRWRSGRWHQQWPSRCFLFFLSQVSQYSIESLPRFIGHDVLVLDATVRRLDDDPDISATKTADLDVDADGRPDRTQPGSFHPGTVSSVCKPPSRWSSVKGGERLPLGGQYTDRAVRAG